MLESIALYVLIVVTVTHLIMAFRFDHGQTVRLYEIERQQRLIMNELDIDKRG